MTQLNDAVRHVLTLKYLAGMFTHPLTDPNRVQTAELTPANLAAARRPADESMVLLNNNNHALPLSTEHAVDRGRRPAGRRRARPARPRRADRIPPDPDGQPTGQDKVVTVRDGIIQRGRRSGNVNYAPGCTTFTVADPCTSSTTGFGAAVDAAQTPPP